MLEAYFDASELKGGTLSVAGFAFTRDGAKKATEDWIRLWGDARCHMTDLHNKPQETYGLTSKEAGGRLQRCVEIINEHAIFTVAVSCPMSEVRRLAPASADPGSVAILGGFRTAYAMCTHAAMISLADLIQGNIDVAYFFESGDRYQAESQRFIALVNSFPDAANYLYKLRSFSVLSKKDCRLFEFSDILAWEWATHIERSARKEQIRLSMKALLGPDLVKSNEVNLGSRFTRGWHLSGEALELYYARAREFELFSDDPSPEARQRMLEALQRFESRP